MLKKYAILCTVCLGTVLSAYVGNCVNLALPNIMAALNFNLDTIVWVSLGYLLPYGSTLPLTGRLGDQYGSKKMYIIGIIVFSVACLCCGLATSSAAMVVFRISQGVGAGLLLPNAMAIVAETFDSHERGQALGIWSAMVAVGSAMGPTVGGYLIESFDWRSIFFSVVPFCFISVGLALAVLPSSKPNSTASADYCGAFFLITSISVLLVALNQGQKEGWSSPYISMLFGVTIASFICFVMVETWVNNPIIEFGLFRNINFTIANVVGFLSFMALNGGTFLLPFFLKSMLYYSSSTAGLTLLPQTVSIVICAPIGGRLADRFGPRLPAFMGIMMISCALYLLDTINLDFSGYQFSLRVVLLGMGLGFTMSPLSSCVMASLPKDKIGVGAGIFNFLKLIGGSIGVVLSETILTHRETYHYQVLSEGLNGTGHASGEVFRLLRSLGEGHGMSSQMLWNATHGWMTGQGQSPHQYLLFKTLISQMVQRQAAVLSFQDVFYIAAVLCFLGGLLSLCIRRESVKSSPNLPR